MTVIYVLKCEKNRYYIGKTDRPLQTRIEEHFNNKGSSWTKKYKPTKVVEEIKDADEFDEDKYTKKYMMKYGIDRVRGGSYTQVNLPDHQLLSLKDELCTSRNLCFRCLRPSHFGNKCYAKTYATGDPIDEDSDDDDIWCCDYCDKEFETEKQAERHVKLCKYRPDSSGEDSDNEVCFRCGRPGHYVTECYANTHLNGRKIYK